MKYKLLNTESSSKKFYSKIEDDGKSYSSCSEDNEDFKSWVEAGNTPDPSDISSWDEVRLKRDNLLQNSDWTMITGATVDQAQWAAYRDKLRAIPQTYKDVADPLKDVVWPTVPSTKGPNTD